MRTFPSKGDCILLNLDHPIKPTRVSYLSAADVNYIMIGHMDIGIRPNGKPKNPLTSQRGYFWAGKPRCLCVSSIPMLLRRTYSLLELCVFLVKPNLL